MKRPETPEQPRRRVGTEPSPDRSSLDMALDAPEIGSTGTQEDSLYGLLIASYWKQFAQGDYGREEFDALVKPLETNAVSDKDRAELLSWFAGYLQKLQCQRRWEDKLEKTRSQLARWFYRFILCFIRIGLSHRAKRCGRITQSILSPVNRSQQQQRETASMAEQGGSDLPVTA